MSSAVDHPFKRRLGFDPAYLPDFQRQMFIEGPDKARRLVNFFSLLGLATVIATYGLLVWFDGHCDRRDDRRSPDGPDHGDYCGGHTRFELGVR